jgi:glycosyltransferase A (GT-A) superfamily protein (DUF2064 family)
MDVLVLAKEPVAGRVKTRLCPPCTPEQAALLAAAALADTLRAATSSSADRVILGLEGSVGRWCPSGVEVVPQGTGSLSQRLELLWSHVRGPAVQIGMDTPQVTASILDSAMDVVAREGAALGLAHDGGWWALGLPHALPDCFDGVEPSRPDTGANQWRRLRELGHEPTALPLLRDVDRWADALLVAIQAPATRFAGRVAEVRSVSGRRPAGFASAS